MRKVLYIALLIPLFFVPLRRVNIADLLPVEAVAIYMDGDQVALETDTGHKGFGSTVENAIRALKENTPAVVYLDTARYLLVSPGAEGWLEDLSLHLKSSVKVCFSQAPERVENMVEYLEIQRDLPRLKNFFKK